MSWRLVVSGLVVAAIVLGATQVRARDANAAFWDWFRAHAAEVATIARGDEKIADRLAAELHKIDSRLTFEVGVRNTPKELIVSADGIRDAFPAVQRLVAAAPPVAGWRVIAFRPRKAGMSIQTGDGRKLGVDDIAFEVLGKHADTIDVRFFVPGIGGADDAAAKQIGYLMLDAELGEYDVETRLAGIDWKPSAARPAAARPLHELPAVVDRLKH